MQRHTDLAARSATAASLFAAIALLLVMLILLAGCSKEPTPAAPPAPSTTTPPATAPQASPPAASTTEPSTATVSNQAAQDLANKSGCFACHAVDEKKLGPSYKEVAAKYRGQTDAEAKLIAKVKNGGVGVWGQIPMPPNAQVSDADIKTLVDWILSQK